jgi:hypothetical protein
MFLPERIESSNDFGLRIANFELRETTMDRDLIDGLDIVLKSAFRNFKSAILVSALLLAPGFLGDQMAEIQERNE